MINVIYGIAIFSLLISGFLVIEGIRNLFFNIRMRKVWLSQKIVRKDGFLLCSMCDFPILLSRIQLEGMLVPFILEQYREEEIKCPHCKFRKVIVIKMNGTNSMDDRFSKFDKGD